MIEKIPMTPSGYAALEEELKKRTSEDRPKIIAMCDVSGSVSQYVRFLLLLLYGLKETIPKLDAYAFSGRLEDVGPMLAVMAILLAHIP